jgi:hypothetical protein
VRLHLGYLQNSEKNPANFTKFLKHRAELELKGRERFGCNPSVFFYQVAAPDTFGLLLMKMCFFEGADIFASFGPEGVVAPGHLGMMLIESGVKSYVTLEDKVYEFN